MVRPYNSLQYYPLQRKASWDYSLPFYLSAKHSLHPNYAKHLIDLATLSIEEIEKILETINVKDRIAYNSKLIQQNTFHFNHQNIQVNLNEWFLKLNFQKIY